MKTILAGLTVLVVTISSATVMKAQALPACGAESKTGCAEATPKKAAATPATRLDCSGPNPDVHCYKTQEVRNARQVVVGEAGLDNSSSPFDNPANAESVKEIRKLISNSMTASDITLEKISFVGQEIRVAYKQAGTDGFELSISLDKGPYSAHDITASQTTYPAVYSVEYGENGHREPIDIMFSKYSLAKRFADLLNSLAH